MIPDRDLGAGGDKALGDGAPKSLRAAGDDGAAAVQIDLVHGENPFASIWHPRCGGRKSSPRPPLRWERGGVRGASCPETPVSSAQFLAPHPETFLRSVFY